MPLNLDETLLRATTRAILALPPGAKRAVFGPPPRSPEGDVLDLDLHAVISAAKLAGATEVTELPTERARPAFERSLRLAEGVPQRGLEVRDLDLAETPARSRVRVYTPHVLDLPSPGVVFFHGGGFTLGSLDSHHDLCRSLCLGLRAVVLAVDYRLAPEHPWPAAVDDALAAWDAVRARHPDFSLDPARLAVAGDSAGGNLAALVSNARRGPAGPCAQWLIYPATDFARTFPSHRSFANAPILPERSIERFLAGYVPDPATHTNPRAAPWYTPDLAGVAPAVVQTAGFDPLRDEGDAYAQRLREAGVEVDHRCERTLLHGWANLGAIVPAAAEALAWGRARLRARLRGRD